MAKKLSKYDLYATVAIMRRPKITPIHEPGALKRCRQCSEMRLSLQAQPSGRVCDRPDFSHHRIGGRAKRLYPPERERMAKRWERRFAATNLTCKTGAKC